MTDIPQPGRVKGYALGWSNLLRHAGTILELGRVSGEDVFLDDLVQAVRQSQNGADLIRVQKNEGVANDWEASRFLVEWALAVLGDAVSADDEGRLALGRPLAELRYEGKPIAQYVDASPRFHDDFNPLTTDAVWAKNSRTVRKDDATWEQLRDSMRMAGWLDGHPAIVDERGVPITGHRRLQVAAELGIEPKILKIHFGSGDAADAQRIQYALGSNLGAKGLSPADRQKWAMYLYGERGWTMVRIAEALHVSQATISTDLAEVISTDNSHPERGGRPRKKLDGDTPPVPRRKKPITEEIVAVAAAGLEEGKSNEAIFVDLAEVGVGAFTANTVIAVAEDRAARAVSPPDAPPKESGNGTVAAASGPCPYCQGTGLIVR